MDHAFRKHHQKLISEAERLGCTKLTAIRRSKHYLFVATRPNGESVRLFVAATPSDHLAWRNNIARLRRGVR